jgi:hypothetical protein
MRQWPTGYALAASGSANFQVACPGRAGLSRIIEKSDEYIVPVEFFARLAGIPLKGEIHIDHDKRRIQAERRSWKFVTAAPRSRPYPAP